MTMTAASRSSFQVEAGPLSFTFLSSGDLYQITHNDTMINQLLSNAVDGSLNNIYLRLHRESGIVAVPLLGVRSNSRVSYSASQVVWAGEAEGVRYQVRFLLSEAGVWFWDVLVVGNGEMVDVIYGQDIGLADQAAVRSNEAYQSQYIDHSVFEDEQRGYVVCSRQNMPQRGSFPYLQQGAWTGAGGYSTDGFQFYGLSYKETDMAEALMKPSLANEVYQYEFAYTALQAPLAKLDGELNVVFYSIFKENHAEAVSSLAFTAEVQQAWEQVSAAPALQSQEANPVRKAAAIGSPLQTVSMTAEEINGLFPERSQEEYAGESLLSFFTATHEHVVLKEKELLVERPHGHILMTGGNDRLNTHVLTTTSYMYGLFNSQLVVGNTTFHKWVTNARNALNVPKTSGQRIYVELDGVYRLLTMPSMFEMGFNFAKWYYKTSDDLIIITNYTTVDTPEVRMHVRSTSGRKHRYLVTNQVSMNDNEYILPYHMSEHQDGIEFTADSAALSSAVYSKLRYRLRVDGAEMTVADEQKLVTGMESGGASLVVLELGASSEWSLTVQGLLQGEELPAKSASVEDAEAQAQAYRAFYKRVMNGFQLTQKGGNTAEVDKFNTLAWWYTHNMLVHYSVPHGLEQYGGAAWGTRDVCQGPTEYFMAMQNYGAVREILLTVFSHQYEEDGNWPQWFMFDNYVNVQQEESHGDIIVWPLKVLSDYLTATQDYSVLEEQIPYTTKEGFAFTSHTASLLEHAQKEIAYIKGHFLHDTHLSSYGDGDWDDTLQPANAQLKQYMVSSWTVALTYQVFTHLSAAMQANNKEWAAELGTLSEGIKADFNRYMLQTDVIPGFLYMEQPEQAELMLHPSDAVTGIQYRLLPMTRSMIAELLTAEQAEAHYDLIKRELYCPDGVRLMNRPAKYTGGVSTHFKRAEQAANFGREVGLQYVHAHIRYVEAMAKLGKVDEAWNGLAIINPVGLKDAVPNAELRQSNSYFSSSDGKFNTRYEAQERFAELRDGSAPVKGGWRIYSSGPGIYMNQLVANVLGIRQVQGKLIVDPVLPQSLNGLQFDFEYQGIPITFVYHLKGDGNATVKSVKINGNEMEAGFSSNRYRTGGLEISPQLLKQDQSGEKTIIDIFM